MKTMLGSAFLCPVFAGVCLLALSGCAPTDPEDPGIETPALTGVVTGEVTTRRQYADKVEEKNVRNAERGKQGDWRYVQPAVGDR